MTGNQRKSLFFTQPSQVAIRSEALETPRPGQVRVRSLVSAISSGSELLIYRGQAPDDLPVDDAIQALAGSFQFPMQYGYALCGSVEALGEAVDPAWLGRLVFAFHPHEDCFNAVLGDLVPLPDGVSPEDAVFLPNLESAVNFVMDGKPLIGEQVVVFGQGIVGLLTTALLARFPLERLVTLDRFAIRRRVSLALGAHLCLDPTDAQGSEPLRHALHASHRYDGADLVYELSGSPHALEQAIAVAGFGARVVVGSWYGQKRVSLDLGGRFHRARLQLISSQVSSLAPEFSGRWSKARRLETAWRLLPSLRPSAWITHRFPLEEASQAYQLLDQRPEEAIQVVLTYP